MQYRTKENHFSLLPSDFLPPPNERPKEKKCGRALLLMHSREGHFRIWPTGNKINRQGVFNTFFGIRKRYTRVTNYAKPMLEGEVCPIYLFDTLYFVWPAATEAKKGGREGDQP